MGEQDGWIRCREREKLFNFQHFTSNFVILQPLCHGWLVRKHSTDRGQPKSLQSILRNPVALACFLGECCSLTCRTNSNCIKESSRQNFYFDTKLSLQTSQTRCAEKALNSPSLIQSRKDTDTQLHVCAKRKKKKKYGRTRQKSVRLKKV